MQSQSQAEKGSKANSHREEHHTKMALQSLVKSSESGLRVTIVLMDIALKQL